MTVSPSTTAPLANVGLCVAGLEHARNRAAHLPGIVVYHGPSGYGKSFSAAYAANKFRGYYVEVKSAWTKTHFLKAVLHQMGFQPDTNKDFKKKTIPELVEIVCAELAASGRPLIVDEVDFVIDKGWVELLRDLHQGGQGAILLIGEEQLPSKLRQWERVHGRVLEWIAARPASLADARHLANLYCKGLQVADDLLERIHRLAKGSVRRICVNLDRVATEARTLGAASIDLAAWAGRPLYTGEPPKRDDGKQLKPGQVA